MDGFLVDKDQWTVVDVGTKPTAVSAKDWAKLDRKEKSTVWCCISDIIECIKGSYNEDFAGQVRDFVPI